MPVGERDRKLPGPQTARIRRGLFDLVRQGNGGGVVRGRPPDHWRSDLVMESPRHVYDWPGTSPRGILHRTNAFLDA